MGLTAQKLCKCDWKIQMLVADCNVHEYYRKTAKWIHSEVESTNGEDKTHSMTKYHNAFMWDRG